MYLWKYWRESRLVLGACLVGIAVLLVLICHEHLFLDAHPRFQNLLYILPSVLFVQSIPVSFVAWLYGSFGVGHDLGEKSGAYIFSRPRSRAFFVWSDWGFGLTQLLVVVTALNIALGYEVHRMLLAVGDPYSGGILLSNKTVALTTIICLNIAASFLLSALVFSVTYLFTVLARHAKGLMLGAFALLLYLLLKDAVKHYWPSIILPDLIPVEFAHTGQEVTGFVKDLGLSFSIRLAVILLFPLAAQFLLQKRDIE